MSAENTEILKCPVEHLANICDRQNRLNPGGLA
jgi:hypothetical protein